MRQDLPNVLPISRGRRCGARRLQGLVGQHHRAAGRTQGGSPSHSVGVRAERLPLLRRGSRNPASQVPAKASTAGIARVVGPGIRVAASLRINTGCSDPVASAQGTLMALRASLAQQIQESRNHRRLPAQRLSRSAAGRARCCLIPRLRDCAVRRLLRGVGLPQYTESSHAIATAVLPQDRMAYDPHAPIT